MVELRAIVKKHGLQNNYRLKKAELLALLRSKTGAMPSDGEPTPVPSVSANPRPRPPKPMRPPSPTPESSLTPYELEWAFRGTYQSFQIDNGYGNLLYRN